MVLDNKQMDGDSEVAEPEIPFLDVELFPTPGHLGEVLSLTGKARLEKIINSRDPAELVAHLPETDLYLTIKELGLKDALELVGLATPEQTIHFLDLDLWKKDQLDRERIIPWLEVFAACGEQKLRQFLETADSELLLSLFQKCIRVRAEEDREEDQGKKPELKGFTLDRIYYVHFLKEEDGPLLTQVLTFINTYNPVLYQDLLDSLLRIIPAEEEETALRWRKGRLADRGFPDFGESQEIYSYRPIDSTAESALPRQTRGDISFSPPAYLETSGRGSFLYEALSRAKSEAEVNQIKGELAHLANQVLVAEGADPGDLEAIGESTRRAFQTLDLGLRHVSGEDPGRAVQMLQRLPLARIFQAGFSLVLELKFRAEAMFKKGVGWGALEGGAAMLDSPIREVIQGLLLKRPWLYDPRVPGNYRPFRSSEELREVRETLDRLEALGGWLIHKGDVTAAEINRLRGGPLCHPDPPFGAVLLTVVTWWILKGKEPLRPWSLLEWDELGFQFLETDPEGNKVRIKSGLPETWLRDLKVRSPNLTRVEEEALRWWLSFSLKKLEEEIGRIPPGQEIDPRYVSMLLVEA